MCWKEVAYSFLDGFFGYNQVLIKLEDPHKMGFATKWGIFSYKVMPFGLTNAPTMFQRVMSHAFKYYLSVFLEIFMEDLCVHTFKRQEHIAHLCQVFVLCLVHLSKSR